MAAILLMAAIGGWAILTDRISYVATYGVSMNPVYYQDDLVFVIKADSYKVGQIAAYHGSSPGQKVLHRIIGGDAKSGFVFKGDNNQSIDPINPRADQLIGRAVLHIPRGAIWLKPLLSPTSVGMLSFLIVGGNAAGPRTRREIPRGRRKKRVKAMASQGGSRAMVTTVIKALGRLPPPLRVGAGIAAMFAVIALVLGVLGWIKPTAVRQVVPGTGQSLTFSYSAAVPQSPAYDGTTVTSPDPIFRKLVRKLDVKLHYDGPAGTLGVSALLSTSSGWHTTVQLLSGKRLTGTSDTTVTLDLDALDARATSAAKVIGVVPASVSIRLKPRVTATGSAAFEPSLELTLNPLQLILPGGISSLEVDNAASQTQHILVRRDIKILGHVIMAGSIARTWAVLMLLCAAAIGIAIYLIARRDVPVRTRAEIERRHPQLLVHVEPMPSPPGKPVVNVDNFPALVKLAERYGQMILTWRRPDADDFVVRDEGITYRYRVPLDEPALQNVELIGRPGAGSHRRKATSPTQVS